MWIIKPESSKAEDYVKLFWREHPGYFKKDGHKAKMNALNHTYVYNTITKDVFEKYLKAAPLELRRMHNQLFKAIYDGTHNVDEEKKALTCIFNYEGAVDKNIEFSYAVASLIGNNTCTYCNRQYTLTISNQNDHLIRPQFDHWFPQSKYLDLTLSYFNLIPSCSLCNSSLKHDKPMRLKKHIHPYIDKNAGFNFDYHSLGEDADGIEHFHVDCPITAIKRDKKRVKNTLEMFRIEEIYSAHEGLELKDLVELARAYPNDYISNLIERVIGDTGIREEDVYRLIFGIETNEEKYVNRPFSKFKKDIINRLKEQMGSQV